MKKHKKVGFSETERNFNHQVWREFAVQVMEIDSYVSNPLDEYFDLDMDLYHQWLCFVTGVKKGLIIRILNEEV